MAENESPFRKRALEYIITPNALDNLTQITSPMAWVFLIAVWLVIAALVIWLFLGSIVTHVQGKGILLTDQEAIVYVSALDSQNLKVGMAASVNPSVAKQWGFKRISARVADIESLPATPESIRALLKNEILVDYFLKQGPVILLRIELASPLKAGMLIDAGIVARRQTPLSLIFSE